MHQVNKIETFGLRHPTQTFMQQYESWLEALEARGWKMFHHVQKWKTKDDKVVIEAVFQAI